jgi:putative transposase
VKRRRHTAEQIVLAEGTEVPEVARHWRSEATYHRWRAQYGGMKIGDAKRLKELEARTRG